MYKGKEVTKEYTKMLGADPLKKELVQSEKDWIINFGKCVISLKLVALIYTGIINYLINLSISLGEFKNEYLYYLVIDTTAVVINLMILYILYIVVKSIFGIAVPYVKCILYILH